MIKFSSKGHQITVQMICWFLFGAVLLMQGYGQAEENDMDNKKKFAHVISVKVTGHEKRYVLLLDKGLQSWHWVSRDTNEDDTKPTHRLVKTVEVVSLNSGKHGKSVCKEN